MYLSEILKKNHSFQSLGDDFFINTQVNNVPHSRLLLFNKKLANKLNLDLPDSDEELEKIILENFAWFKADSQHLVKEKSDISKRFFSSRYQDSDDKTEGSALGDGRAIWVGEIVNELESGQLEYFDIVLKGTGPTELAWFNHPRKSHKDGQLGLSEAIHEYIYSAAAKTNGINVVDVLAVIELPFMREVDNEKAAIIVRVGNHLRFAHYCYFQDTPAQLQKLFEYGLKRDMGLSLRHTVIAEDVRHYLEFIVNNLATDAAIYFDVHAVHGSPTFGNITSCGGTLDLSTFVYTDAHHSNYSYMPDGVNLLGGEWGQKEQFFNLFSLLVESLKKSHFAYQRDILPVEYFLESFNEKFEQVLTGRWLERIGLSKNQIESLSIHSKERFYEIVKLIYELKGSKKVTFHKRKVLMAAFEPRKILSSTADYIESFDNMTLIWEQLFKVKRNWGSYKFTDAKPYIEIYRTTFFQMVNELNPSKEDIAIWQQRSKTIRLSTRKEPGDDFFYDSERFFASEETLQLIKSKKVSWRKISEAAEKSSSKLADHGFIV